VPDRSDPEGKRAYDAKLEANTDAISATGLFFLGLAAMEEIDSDAWFAGKIEQPWMARAVEHLTKASESFGSAARACLMFKEWFPAERREEVTPDIEHFLSMQKQIAGIAEALRDRKLPTLTEVHAITTAMRTQQVAAERKAVALRGTRGHFPAGHP